MMDGLSAFDFDAWTATTRKGGINLAGRRSMVCRLGGIVLSGREHC